MTLRSAAALAALAVALSAGRASAQDTLIVERKLVLRAAASASAHPVRTLESGERVMRIASEDTAAAFAKVRDAQGNEGFVSRSFVKPASAPAVHPAAGARGSVSCGTATCGIARWPVKTLTDDDAGEVDLTPVTGSIAAMRQFHAPHPRPQSNRVGIPERTTYKVRGVLLGWVHEDDKDFHLIIGSTSNHSATIVAEIPDPACKAVCLAGAPLAHEGELRAALTNVLGAPPSACHTFAHPIPIEITGVGFFDTPGGHATGHPPNGFELHPVLSLTLNGGAAVPDASKASTPGCSFGPG